MNSYGFCCIGLPCDLLDARIIDYFFYIIQYSKQWRIRSSCVTVSSDLSIFDTNRKYMCENLLNFQQILDLDS